MRKLIVLIFSFSIILSTSALANSPFGDRIARICFDYLYNQGPNQYAMNESERQEWYLGHVEGNYLKEEPLSSLSSFFVEASPEGGGCSLRIGASTVGAAYVIKTENVLILMKMKQKS